MLSTRNERAGLLVATIIFAILAIVQLWRGFADWPLRVNGTAVPDWVSFVVGIILAAMAIWMGSLLKHRRPLV